MPSYKLIYFDLPGRGEPIRLAFHTGGVAFTDERVKFEDFHASKSSYPFGQLPVLEVDGKTRITQTSGLLRYVGSLTGLYPKDPLEAAKVDHFLGAIDDICSNVAAGSKEPDPNTRMAIRKKNLENFVTPHLGFLDKQIGLLGTNGCTVGGKLTVADLFLYTLVGWLKSGQLEGIPADLPDRYPNVKRVYETVVANEKVASWKKSH